MNNFILLRRTIILMSFFILIGCAVTTADETEKMLTLGSAMTKLSAAVESTVRYKNPPADISDANLLVLATKHDPALLEPFSAYTVRVRQQELHAIILVCTKDGTRALLEDAGCTGKLDRHLWENQPAIPCEFTLIAREACVTN